jgi:hypothetical protein
VSLAQNRVSGDVNVTRVAALLEGYSGSDIKEASARADHSLTHSRH